MMAQSSSESPTDDFFNDLSRQAYGSWNRNGSGNRSSSPKNTNSNIKATEEPDGFVPRTKRIACIICRKRKLKCDGTKPSCGTCARLGHSCAYDEVRKKSGPKRGYVKHLEARLAQVETLLKTQEPPNSGTPVNAMPRMPSTNTSDTPSIALPCQPLEDVTQLMPNTGGIDPTVDSMMGSLGLETLSWELIGLGLEEPLPSQEVIDDMHRIYFEKIHPSMPIIHRPRYLAAMNLAPSMRPPVCLRYAMWTWVCSITPKYSALTEHFYARARKYAEKDEMKGFGESMVTVAHCQCWCLISNYEFKTMYFPRAWQSVGRATRLGQILGLQTQGNVGPDVKQVLPPPRDWIEREERRRTFWLTFCQDRYASMGTGWPMTIDEKDITTTLPASDEAYINGTPEVTRSLSEVMTVDGASTLSSFGAVVLMASLFGRQHLHLHRPDREDNEHDLNGQFWKRHRSLDNLLLSTSLSLPYHLRLPAGIHDPNIVFVNMTLPALVICLHQAAIFKADRNHLSSQISTESKRRCIIAADQIANLMKSVCHIDLATMNPFLAFCLYIASRVFVQYLKSQKDDSTVVSSLQFLLSAMDALKTGAPLSGSFLAQLEVELEGSDFTLSQSSRFPRPPNSKSANVPADHECATVFELGKARDRGQATAAKANTPAVSKAAGGNSLDFSQPQSISLEPYMGRFADPCTDSSRPPAPDPVFNPTTPAYEENSYFMDMDMPFENTNSPNVPSQQNSGHPTPSTSSNNASSQTSFTPPHQEDYPNLAKTSSGTEVVANTASQAAFFAQQQRFTTLDSNFSTFMKGPFPEGPSNPLGMSAAWSQSENGQRLGNAAGEFILNGITAEDIASWQPENMVAGNDWEFPGWASDNTTS